ncbi:MAG: DMT family transporter [Desulfobacteraceae bacterium]|nr:DMT family transporter [Desulfobacteraceae bacterium]
MAALLAIIASFFYGLHMVVVRIGLKDMNVFSGGVISMVVSFIGALVLLVFFPPVNSISPLSVFFFALAGFSGPCLGRLLLYLGINRVGSAIASSLYSVKPLFAALVAIAFLGEKITTVIGIGTLIIIIGLIIISSNNHHSDSDIDFSKKDLIFPILAGASYGISHIFRKSGLGINAEPILGLLVQNIAALSFPLFITFWQNHHSTAAWKSLRGWTIFSLAGICAMLGQLCLFWALNTGEVVIVAPLSTISPIFVLLIAALFLKGLEHVTWKLGMGASFLLAGAILLTVP